MELSTFEEMRRNAYGMLGDVEDELRSDWRRAHHEAPDRRSGASWGWVSSPQGDHRLR